MSKIYRVPTTSYERQIPSNLEEAMSELDRRIMISGQTNFGKVNARMVFRELLEDYTQGLEKRSREKSYVLIR